MVVGIVDTQLLMLISARRYSAIIANQNAIRKHVFWQSQVDGICNEAADDVYSIRVFLTRPRLCSDANAGGRSL